MYFDVHSFQTPSDRIWIELYGKGDTITQQALRKPYITIHCWCFPQLCGECRDFPIFDGLIQH